MSSLLSIKVIIFKGMKEIVTLYFSLAYKYDFFVSFKRENSWSVNFHKCFYQ